MKKIVILFLSVTIVAFAGTIDARYPPLFAKVTGVAENDVLNVRVKPNYKSKKVAEIPSAHDFPLVFGVERCTRITSSVWCRVYPIAQHWSENFGGDVVGWVNARYLKPNNKGYVIIDGKKDCDVALRCKKGKCEVVKSYKQDKNHNITSIKTHWIARSRLRGESRFGAMSEEGDGYCTMMKYIEDYFKRKRIDELAVQCSDDACRRVIDFVQKLTVLHHREQIAPYIHPKQGVVMTWNVLFGGKEVRRFTRKNILDLYVYDKNKGTSNNR